MNWLIPITATSILLFGCGDSSDESKESAMPASPDEQTLELPPGCQAYVEPGPDSHERLQTHLIEAAEGDVVCLAAGTFNFKTELSISVDAITLKGAGREETILDFKDQDLGANGIHVTSDGVTVEGFHVRDTPGDGIRASAVEGITFRNVAVTWTTEASPDNGAYGFYPVQSRQVLIEGCLVKGSSDAGIYVGQSRGILVRNNEALGNVGGIQIENSVDAEVVENYAHDNSAGILVFNLPELPMKVGFRTKVHNNRAINNNLPNFAKPGAIIYQVPQGTGIIVLASDENEFTNNLIEGNQSTGIVIAAYNGDLFGLYDDPEFDPYSERNFIHGNTFVNNGYDPQGLISVLNLARPSPDILFDGCLPPSGRADNCIQEDPAVRFQNLDLCSEEAQPTSEMQPYDCRHDPLPTQLNQ